MPTESALCCKGARRIIGLCSFPLSINEVFDSTLPNSCCSAAPIIATCEKHMVSYLKVIFIVFFCQLTITNHCYLAKVSKLVQTSKEQSKREIKHYTVILLTNYNL